MILEKKLILVFIFIFLIITLGGCSTSVKMSYSPAYIEKRELVESTLSSDKPISILLLNFKDKRHHTNDPLLIYKNISLEDQTLSEYLYSALLKDLQMLGFNVIKNENKKLSIKELELGKKNVDKNINFVLTIDIIECVPDYIMNWSTAQPYSTFDFQITIWDNTKSKIVYNKHIIKKIMGVKTASTTFKNMVYKLLNEDLTVINIDIAEILTNL